MPRLSFRDVIVILKKNNFTEKRTTGSHTQYEAVVGGVRRLVTVQTNHKGKDVSPQVLNSIIRQSGLSKSLFR